MRLSNQTRLLIAAFVSIAGSGVLFYLTSDPSQPGVRTVKMPTPAVVVQGSGEDFGAKRPVNAQGEVPIDAPQREDQKLEMPGLRAFDWFGSIVAIDGDRILVGSGGDDTEGPDLGAAHIFRRTEENRWVFEATLRSRELKTHRRFAYSGTISGNTVAIGAEFGGPLTVFEADEDGRWSDSVTLQPNDVRPNQMFGGQISMSQDLLLVGAEQDPETGLDGGAAYVFQRLAAGEWKQISKLVSHDLKAHDQLGAAVGISGKTAIVGSRHNDGNTGSAYIFQENEDGVWKEMTKLKSGDPHPFDQFGISVAISGDTAIVGEWRDSEQGYCSGAAHLFQRGTDGVWNHRQKLKASDPEENDCFGYAVAISDRHALIGTLRLHEDKRCGSSYVFRQDAQERWQQIRKLLPTDSRPLDKFGSSVALTNKYVVVGAEGNSVSVASGGAAYVFSIDIIPGTSQ